MKNWMLGLLLLLGLVASCKKDLDKTAKSKVELPTFAGLDLDETFDHVDLELKNRDSVLAVMDQYYTQVWENTGLSGGLLVAKGDEILFEKYRGFAQPDNREPITETTPLHVASVSKTLTAMATLKLVEAGKLDLNQKVSRLLPNFPYPEVTVFHLLSQRSGLPKYEYFVEKIPEAQEKKFLTNQDILDLLIQYKPESAKAAGQGFMYCNTNYALLALIIERITERPFPQAMKEMVFEPLKMKHSYVFQAKDSVRAAKSFLQRGNRMVPFSQLDLIYGDKNVYTTPRDLHRFSMAMFHKDFLRKDLMEKIFQPYSNEKAGVNNYGLGFRMKIFDNGEKITFHNGWWHGSNAVFAHLLKSNVTLVAIGNRFSRRVYSALTLSGLFENFPLEKEKLWKELNPKNQNLPNPSGEEALDLSTRPDSAAADASGQ